MATLFRPRNRQSFYHRAIVPRRLRPYFRGRQQLWRSLKTIDKDDATLKSIQWEARAQQVFLTLKRHGAHMTYEEIDALIARWTHTQLEEWEDWHAENPVTEDWHDDTAMIKVDQMEALSEDLDRCDYQRVEHDADKILKAASLPLLDHGSLEFKRFCRQLIIAKIDLLRF